MPKETGIRTEELHIGYRSDLIRDITMSVEAGKIVTLIGPNGCGKTTLLKTLTGQLRQRGGVVYLQEQDRTRLGNIEIAKRMSVVMTNKVRAELMICREVVQIGRYPYTGHLGILSQEDQHIVDEAMIMADVKEIERQLFQNISDGQKQRVLLARAICQQPKILVLDEPTSFLDIRHKLTILQKIRDYAKTQNVAVLMSLHELEIAKNISDTVVALGEGKVLRMGKPDEVFTESFIRKLYQIEGMDTQLLGAMPWEESSRKAENITKNDEQEEPAVNETLQKAGEKNRKPAVIMIQGTMSNVGKSVIAAGLCRIFTEDGYRVAPFKSQNMALNSYITDEGLEMGRAQVMQAECAKTPPLAAMNPILLKPTSDTGSQVIVNGKVVGNMKAAEYFKQKHRFVKDILAAYDSLCESVDIIVIEGAGSPVEMNLKAEDIVNMGLAEMVDAPVLLVGDIDRGGVFAQLLGTLDLFTKKERARVKGMIVNQFRGDATLFEDGIKILEEKGDTKVVGVVPHLPLILDDEDSLSGRFQKKEAKDFDVAVIRLSHISNFTDFDPFEQVKDLSLRYVSKAADLGEPDLIILPGSKNTIGDLQQLQESGMADAILQKANRGTCIIGICGGFQMLGRKIEDPYETEEGGCAAGLGLLPVDTVMNREKTSEKVTGSITHATGVLKGMEDTEVSGYEIHMGKTTPYEEVVEFTQNGSGYCLDNIYGTYMHGFFDRKEVLKAVIEKLATANNKKVDTEHITDYSAFKERQYSLLAKGLREHLDMNYIYSVMGLNHDV